MQAGELACIYVCGGRKDTRFQPSSSTIWISCIYICTKRGGEGEQRSADNKTKVRKVVPCPEAASEWNLQRNFYTHISEQSGVLLLELHLTTPMLPIPQPS